MSRKLQDPVTVPSGKWPPATIKFNLLWKYEIKFSSECLGLKRNIDKYRLKQISMNRKYSFVLTGIFLQNCASKCLKRYHRVVSCVLNVGDLIANNLCKFSK